MFVTEINNGEIILSEEYENILIKDAIKNILHLNNEILIFGNNTYKIEEGCSLFAGNFSGFKLFN